MRALAKKIKASHPKLPHPLNENPFICTHGATTTTTFDRTNSKLDLLWHMQSKLGCCISSNPRWKAADHSKLRAATTKRKPLRLCFSSTFSFSYKGRSEFYHNNPRTTRSLHSSVIMRFFKKKDEIDPIEVRRTRSQDPDFASHYLSGPPGPAYSKSDVGTGNKRSIGELAKMLNCASAKVKEEDHVGGEQSIFIGGNGKDAKIPGIMKRSSSWGGALRKSHHHPDFESDITRPVLITIKDGALGASVSKKIASRDLLENAEAMRELKNSFIIGPPPPLPPPKTKSSSFLFGASARRRPTEKVSVVPNNQTTSPNRINNSSNNSNNNNNSPQREPSENQNNSPARSTGSTPNPASLHAAREIARKERWRRGLEMEKKAGDGVRSTISCASNSAGPTMTDGEDSACGEEDRTHFTHSTGGTSYYTEEDFSSLGGYSTEATETDESGDDSRYHRRRRDGSRSSLRSPPQLDYLSPNGFNDGHCSTRQQVISGITEDFGIVASFLWADGTACLGTAAAITRETVAGCKPDP